MHKSDRPQKHAANAPDRPAELLSRHRLADQMMAMSRS